MKAVIVLPFDNGAPQFPGIAEDAVKPGFVILSYAPPPAGTAPYCLCEIQASSADVATLTAQANCLFLAEVVDNVYVPDNLAPTERNAIRAKVATMFTGAIYGLLNAAIQSSQNRSELIIAMATKAFFRNKEKDFMSEEDLKGAGLG